MSDDDTDTSTELAEERTEFAEERTEWADQRTYLAQERTFSGWIRTSLTSIAVGFGIIELMRDVDPEWLISTIGFLFLVTGGFIAVIAFISHRKVSLKMRDSSHPDMAISSWWIATITIALLTCAIAGLTIVFVA